MTLKIENHLLVGDGVKHQLITGKDSGLFKRLDTIVYHYTASTTLESAVNTLANSKVKACAHLVIGDNATIIQLVPFNKITWHAGESKWRDRTDLNKYSIGIEIRNAGYLTKSGTIYRTVYGTQVPKEEVIYAQHRNEKASRYWEVYKEKQLAVIKEISELLIDVYDIKFMLGHEEVAPGRKTDPGPAFPLDKLRSDLLTNNRQDAFPLPTEGIITSAVNLRRDSSTLTSPLGTISSGTKVAIVGEKNGFYETLIRGYIKKEFIEGNK